MCRSFQCRLIVNCMSNTRCQAYNHLLTPLAGIVACVYFQRPSATCEQQVLAAYALLAVLAHLHYGMCVVRQLAEHFNIYAFSTQKKPPRVSANGDSKHK